MSNIRYRLMPDGAFVAGEVGTGFTTYAYPNSINATKALRQPEAVAREMLVSEAKHRLAYSAVLPNIATYDLGNWRMINRGEPKRAAS